MNYDKLIQSAFDEVENSNSSDDLEKTRVKYFGKNGLFTQELKLLSALSVDQKKEYGKKLNNFKNDFFSVLSHKKEIIENQEINKNLEQDFLDTSLPAREFNFIDAKIHPITQTINEITSILGSMGLTYEEGPDIEDDFHNFTALNIPKDHPARQMHDTFYLNSKIEDKYVLRTHTSPVQIRALKKKKLPLKIFAPGRTYRCDSDITHTPMFHQVEGLIVDKNITFANLKWFLELFCKTFFKKDKLKLRFRPSYFPFTEPSAEVDINYKSSSGKIIFGEGKQWMEILGCGMVHPEVFKLSGVTDNVTGFAFGMGIERLAMLKYGMPDLRDFFNNDLKWLEHYGFSFFEKSDLSWR